MKANSLSRLPTKKRMMNKSRQIKRMNENYGYSMDWNGKKEE
jgi:hypothetical protein